MGIRIIHPRTFVMKAGLLGIALAGLANISPTANAQTQQGVQSALPQRSQMEFVDFINQSHRWVDSVFQNLSLRERVAQLFMVRAHSNLGQAYIDSVAQVVQQEQLGGMVLFQGGPIGHAQVINRYQSLTKVPMLVALDGEWGLGMRLDSTISYPYQMTLGAIQDEGLIREMGRHVGQDFRRIGMHVNFAPVVDVNNNANNPVINFRSFGEDKENVTRKSLAYMQGMMDEGLIISLKHFPGHGDTDVDSHDDLPVLPFDRVRLDDLEMYPFKKLIAAGASGVMVAHMHIPSLDSTENMPSSISKPIVKGLLQEDLGFRGLVFTDAMNMKGVVKYFPEGEADLMAIQAGHDLLELSENSGRAIELIIQAVSDGRLSEADLNSRVKRVLAAKMWLGLDRSSQAQVAIPRLHAELNRPSSQALLRQLAEHAVTLLNSDSPIRQFNSGKRTAIVSIGEANGRISAFQQALGRSLQDKLYFIVASDANQQELDAVRQSLAEFEQVVLCVHDSRARPRNQSALASEVAKFVQEQSTADRIVCYFANPYALRDLPGLSKAGSLLVCYQNDAFMQDAAASVVLGRVKAQGLLPVSIEDLYRAGEGIQ